MEKYTYRMVVTVYTEDVDECNKDYVLSGLKDGLNAYENYRDLVGLPKFEIKIE